MRKFIATIAILPVLLACSKKKVRVEGDYSEIPSIALVSINNTEMTEFKDSVIAIISYKDLNGDLGRQNPDDNSLYVKDERLAKADYYHLPPITPDDLEFKTRGTIRIVVPTLFLFGNGGAEKTTLTFKVQDQAGNWSNEVVTSEITINRKQ